MNIIQYGRQLVKIKAERIVIWGMGKYGARLYSEACAYLPSEMLLFCDENEFLCKKDSKCISPLELESILPSKSRMAVIIAVKNEEAVNEIHRQLIKYGMTGKDSNIFRYIPESRQEWEGRKSKEGFFNGREFVFLLDLRESGMLLEKMIQGNAPFFLSRWGSVEGNAVYGNQIGFQSESNIMQLQSNAGVFPVNNETVVKSFYRQMEDAAKQIDLFYVGYWCRYVEELFCRYSPKAKLVSGVMYPFSMEKPWTKALKGMKVLVVHPFAKLIQRQYEVREKIFQNPDILPPFNLRVYRAIQSIGGSIEYSSWTEALRIMEEEIANIDFDIALIGCGAYGMPLGAFIKETMGKKAVHIGGTLQLLFGIKGKRWEEVSSYGIQSLYNEYWVRPTEDLKPVGYEKVEGGCYW